MISSTLVDYGHFLLKRCLTQSAIFDFWYGEVRAEGAYVPCLVRRLLPPYSQGPEYVQAFRGRCRESQAVLHPCMRRPLEFGIVSSVPHAVFGLEPGWNLGELCHAQEDAARSFPPEVVAAIVLPVAHLLASVHARPGTPLVHGALQPSSVWLDVSGMVRVSDFEIGPLNEFVVRALDRHDPRRQFIAPERALHWSNPSPPVDVFSVGALAIHLLALGRLTPVQLKLPHKDQLALLSRHRLPDTLLRLLASCVSTEPGHRPPMATLHRSLKQWRDPGSGGALATYLAGSAPPMPELAQMARGEEAVLEALRNVPRDESVFSESTMTVTPVSGDGETEEDGSESGTGWSSRARRLVAVAAVVLVALVLFGARDRLARFLEPPGGPMALAVVTSDPAGATIELPDGKVLGTTPLKIPVHVAEDGTVALKARLRGYYPPPAQTLSVRSGDQVEFHFQFEKRPPGPATVRVLTLPPGARISVDGKARGRSPVEVGGLFSGDPHQVRATLSGYKAATQTVTLVPGEVTEVVLDLERAAARIQTGQLMVIAYPSGTLSVDGRELGPTGENATYRVAAGRRTIRVYDPVTGRQGSYVTVIRPGATEVLEYTFGSDRWRIRASNAD